MFVVFLAFVSFNLTRLYLLISTGDQIIPISLWPNIFFKGLLFDAAMLAYVIPPILIADALMPKRVRSHRWFFHLNAVLFSLTIFLLLFLSVAEIVFWMEFHTRFNFIALDYLIYTTEVINNIWQSYPIAWIIIVLATVAGFSSYFLCKKFLADLGRELSDTRKIILVVLAILLPVLSYRLVHIEMMYHQGNALAEEISGNGLFTLAAAARHNELDYERFYATIPQEKADEILRRLGVEWTDDLNRRENDPWGDDLNDHEVPSFILRRPRNVVLISVESLSASFVGAFGSTDGITPELDRLAASGYIFSKLFATGTRTVRGLEALSLATPPIPGQAIIRRPRNSHLASIGEMLFQQGTHVMFFYGGNGYFDNMNVFFEANNYKVFDRSSIQKENVTFENAWGVADEDLYNNVLRILDQVPSGSKPFFAHVMTTSNHRPYTYPNGRIDIPSPGGRRGAVKYTDFSIGKFISDAQTRAWFKDTLFVVTADHCASVAGKTELPVADYRIPIIFYGPSLVKPGRSDRMVSQIDISPTLLDILGKAGDDNFFGKEIPEQEGPARSFISNYQNLGYYKSDQLVVLKPKRIIETYRVDPTNYEATVSTVAPELVEEAVAYYQTASRAFKLGKLELLWK